MMLAFLIPAKSSDKCTTLREESSHRHRDSLQLFFVPVKGVLGLINIRMVSESLVKQKFPNFQSCAGDDSSVVEKGYRPGHSLNFFQTGFVWQTVADSVATTCLDGVASRS